MSWLRLRSRTLQSPDCRTPEGRRRAIPAEGQELNGPYYDIHLSDARRAKPENLKTIVCLQVR